MSFSPMMLLSIAPKLADYLKAAIAHYGDLRAAGGEVTPDILAMFLMQQTSGWNPSLSGKAVLDEETRIAMCRFLAGVAFNFAK